MRYISAFFFLLLSTTLSFADTQRGIQFYNAKDYVAAEKEFRGPVAAGDGVAIRYYANMLYQGLGGDFDRARAKEILRKSYRDGDIVSGRYLASLLHEPFNFYFDGVTEEDFARLTEASKLTEETYDGPTDRKPATRVANIFFRTDGKIATKESMIVWLKRAVLEGHGRSAWELAGAYSSGNTVKKDPKEAFYWAEYAAFLGYTEAQRVVGIMYAEGRNTSKKPDAAFALIVQAAEDRDPTAMVLVAEHYAIGGSWHGLGMSWRALTLTIDRGLEENAQTERLKRYLLERNADQAARDLNDAMYNMGIDGLIRTTKSDYQAAVKDFEGRIRERSE